MGLPRWWSTRSRRVPASLALWPVAWIVAVGCGDDVPDVVAGGSGLATGGGESSGDSGASGEGSESGPAPAAFCDGPTVLRYDPLAGGLDVFPDDFYTVDAETPTGLRVDMRLGDNVVLSDTAAAFETVFNQASTLDGWGTTAGAYVRFSDAVESASLPPSPNVTPTADDAILWIDLDATPPALVPFEWSKTAEDVGQPASTVVVRPLRPLAENHRYALAVTDAATDLQGDCIAPSETTRQLLLGEAADPALVRLSDRIDDGVDALIELGAIEAVQSLSGLVAFTTQHTVADSMAVAEAIRAADAPAYLEVAPCADTDPAGSYLICEGEAVLDDYTGRDGAVDPSFAAQGSYTLPVTVYLPTTGQAPFPTLIYGHGLGGTRAQGEELAEFAAPEGFAVLTLPAPSHGAHPDTTEFNDVLDFFGLSFDLEDPLDAFALRDNFRQATFDKLQLVQMLRAGVSVVGDDAPELDPDSLHYLGVSLGGIMGPEFLALAPEIRSGTLVVPGARVTSIVEAGEDFEGVIGIFAAMSTNGEIARFFPLVQGVIDRGDPAVYAPYVVQQRLPGFDAATPDVVMLMVIGDTTVPNVTNAYYARAMGLPHLGEVRLDIAAEVLADLPVSANVGERTAGVFQYDVIDVGGGPDTQPASHGNVARSQVAQTQILHFVTTLLDEGVAEIIDPYVALGIE